MARTVNATLHMVRRDAFLDVAQRLVQAKGYEAMSIQDVLDELEASKGAFYHYFESKQALLLHDPNLPAMRKLERFFAGIARRKAEQKELVLAIIEIWNSDGNAIVREKLRRLTVSRMVPLLSTVIKQGTDEGIFHVASPDETATVFVSLMLGFQELANEYF